MAGSRRALIVATNDYEDPGLSRLRSPARDAQALAEVLGDPSLGDFQVEIVQDETSYAIGERVESLFAEGKPDDLLLLHFSCHGLKDDYGELYLAARNTRPDRLAATGVDAALVNRLMRRSRAHRVILLLDCCYGGAFERGTVARAGGSVDVGDQFARAEQELGGGRGRVVIAASTSMEFAFEGTDLADGADVEPSIFTGALVEGLTTGLADRDHDGLVSLGELYDFVFERVRERSPKQTPGKWEFGLQGELIVARNPQRVVVPTDLPAELLDVIDHQVPRIRVGAVQVLEELASGVKLPVAAAARERLEQIAQHDDSKLVLAEAEAALARTRVRLSQTSVDFGSLPAGTAAEADIMIEGVPLAQASSVSASTPALKVKRAESAFRIELLASEPGPFEGRVTVTGPAGDAEVLVTAIIGGVAVAPVAPIPEQPAPAPPVVQAAPAPVAAPAAVPASAPSVDRAVEPAPAGMIPAALTLGGWGLLAIASLMPLAYSAVGETVEELELSTIGPLLSPLKLTLGLSSLGGLVATALALRQNASRAWIGLALGLAIGAIGLCILMLIELAEASGKLGSVQGAVPLVPGVVGVAIGSILFTRKTEAAPATARPSGPVLGLLAVAGVLALLRAAPNFAEFGRPLDALDEAVFLASLATWVVLSVQSRFAPPLLAGWLAGTALGYALSGVGFMILGGEKVTSVPLLQFGAPALVLTAAFLVFRESERSS